MAVMALSQFQHFDKGKVVKIRGKGDFHRRLCKMGLVVGSVIQTVKLDDEADLVEYRVNKGTVLLRRNEMAAIHVEII